MTTDWTTDFLEILGEAAAARHLNVKTLMKVLEEERQERHLHRRHNIYSNLKKVVSEEAARR